MFQTSDGVGLHVEDSTAVDSTAGDSTGGDAGGEDTPVTVLLAHGWTSDSRVWDAVLPSLAARFRVIRFDHRGHGKSANAPDPTLERLGDDLAELITALAPTGRLVLVGHSMGGMAMMALAARHPDLVRARVDAAFFVSTSSGRMREITFGLPRPVAKAGQAVLRGLNGRRRPPSANPRPAGPRKPPSPVQARAQLAFLRWLLFGARYQRGDLLSVADQLRVAHRGSAAALRSSINRHAAAEALRVYRELPTQVLTGERDRLIPAEHSRTIAAELPDAELVVYPGAGHMLPYERVEDLAARVSAAL